MSRKKRGMFMRFEEDAPMQASMNSENDTIEADFGNAQEVVRTSYRFGDGLLYDYDTNTLAADKTDDIEAGNGSMVTSDGVARAFADSGVSYMSDERIAGRWADGKILYERTITVNDVTIHNVRENSFTHGIENVDIMIVPEAYLQDGSITRADGNFINATCGVILGNNAIMMQWVADDTYVWLNSTAFFNANENRTWKIVVRYTKVGNE